MKDCRVCGKPMYDGDSFCPHCMRRQDEPDSLDNTPISPPAPAGKRHLFFLLPILLLSVPATILIWYFTGQTDPPYRVAESNHTSSLNASSSRPSAPFQSTAPPTTGTSAVYTTTAATEPPVAKPPFDPDAVIRQLSMAMEATGAYVADSDISSMKLVMLDMIAPIDAAVIRQQMESIANACGYAQWEELRRRYPDTEYFAPFIFRYHLEYTGTDGAAHHYFRLYLGLLEPPVSPEITWMDVQKVLELVDAGARGRLEKTLAVYAEPHVSTYSITYERSASDGHLSAEEQVAANILSQMEGGSYTEYALYLVYATSNTVEFILYLA